jgi:Zn-dependent protease
MWANILAMAGFFLQTLFAVGFGFVLHELGHKYVAQKKGLWAEFRAWPTGLLLAVIMAVVSRGSFVFAAPGAVMIAPGKKTNEILKKQDVGLIGIIGVVINIMLAAIFGLLALVFAAKIFIIGAQVNAWLAIFNLIPISMLDGAKVFYWSKGIWLGTFLLAIFIFGLSAML